LQAYCPSGFYVQNTTFGHLECRACPSGKSTSVGDNQAAIQSCICSEGHYGTFGDSCIPCPKNVEGFNCSLKNQYLPSIQSGFYIDYSLLNDCTEYSPRCPAITKCPNPKACPGAKEKHCLKADEECYDEASFGCTACCYRYYMENLKCSPCPPSQLPLILGLATLALILFAIFSSNFDFPPLVSSAQCFKLFLSSMQAFATIRLFDVSWPPVVLTMFDFTRFFTFNFDVIRPECTVDYSPETKLLFVLIGPFVCAIIILMMTLAYTGFKCLRIARILQHESVQSLLQRDFSQTVISVAQCMCTSTLCLKFSEYRQMVDGAFWNAMNPGLAQRTNLAVLVQKKRRKTNLQQRSVHARVSTADAFEDWTHMKAVVAKLCVQDEFTRSAKRIRHLIASAMSIFVFTFQGCVETALKTFDCKDVNGVYYLVMNPKYKCSANDRMYSSMTVLSSVGLAIFLFILPLASIVIIRSSWCRHFHLHDNAGYVQLFGFLTSTYSRAHPLWEIVVCIRKTVFVAVPLLISKVALVQSLAMFTFMIVYSLLIVKIQPMANQTLNQIELLACISVLMGTFSSFFFIIEYNGRPVLNDLNRDIFGTLLVVASALCAVQTLRLMRKDFASEFFFSIQISIYNCSFLICSPQG
jgi:hypothetical protein